MTEFNIQRGSISFDAVDTAKTITAGPDYVAPSSAVNSFIRIVGHNFCGDGSIGDFVGTARRNIVFINNPGNLLTSVTFSRTESFEPITVEWEIIEYIGDVGGQYEFIVRHTEVLGFSGGDLSKDTSAVPGVSNDSDVVVFITSHGGGNNGARSFWNRAIGTSEWISASDVGRVTRGNPDINTVSVSVAVVEFTGSSWAVQRVPHSYTAANSDEDETIATLGAVEQAFIHSQIRSGGGTAHDHGQTVYILNATTLRHRCDNINTFVDAVTWIIEDTSGSMKVAQYSGARLAGAGASPDSWTETISAVTVATTSIMGECSQNSGNSDGNHMCIGFELTGPTTVTLRRGPNHESRDYRFQIVEWPEVTDIGGLIPAVLMNMGEL